MADFFISYDGSDRAWAEWTGWQLEAAGYTVKLQAWDFRPGSNFVVEMQQAAAECERTLAEGAAAIAKDNLASLDPRAVP